MSKKNYEECDIGEHRWTVTKWSGRKGVRIIAKLGKLLSGPVGKAMSAMMTLNKIDGKEFLDTVTTDDIGEAFGLLAEKLDDSNVEKLLFEMLEQTKCDGQEMTPQLFDIVFMGNYLELVKVVVFVVGVNLSVPLDGLQAFLGPREEKTTLKGSILAVS